MFNQPHKATLVKYTKDAFGTISASTEDEFDCLIELDTKYGIKKNQTVVIGIGVIFTTECLEFKEGDGLLIDGVEYIISKLLKGYDGEGVFHHWEIIYG